MAQLFRLPFRPMLSISSQTELLSRGYLSPMFSLSSCVAFACCFGVSVWRICIYFRKAVPRTVCQCGSLIFSIKSESSRKRGSADAIRVILAVQGFVVVVY